MEDAQQAHVAFFLTGRRPADQLDAVDGLNLRPALFARYRTLTELRYDFPLVLADGGSGEPFAESLSGLVDAALSGLSGSETERARKHVLRLEQEIRKLVAGGAGGTLTTLWDKAADALGRGTDKALEDSLKRARKGIKLDGELTDCDEAMPARLIRHGWSSVQQHKAAAFGKNIAKLNLKLAEILRSDFESSAAGRSAKNLRESVGSAHDDTFDFAAMSRMLSTSLPKNAFPESRRRRISQLLDVLGSQRFFPLPDASGNGKGAKAYEFFFDSCAAALVALRERMPRVVELARAIAIAELEIDGQYNEARHDALFEQFGANGMDPQDLAPFPDYLICMNTAKLQAAEHAQLMEILSSGLPIKVLLQTDDILKESAIGEGNLTSGMRSRQIANMAMGLNEVYVLQSSASNLARFRDRILRGLAYRGPALFSVFSGASGKASGLSAYLTSAAAMESRAFPAFAYDPSAGPNWASRFYLDANPQVDLDWPVQAFDYEDEDHQSVSQDLAFTLVDFLACDRRYSKHLARVPRAKWNGSMIAVDESLTGEKRGLPEKVPCLLMVDADNSLQKVIVDDRLIREARRCREMWHSLQELGGVHNSHAETLLAREKKAWEERMHQEVESHPQASAVAAPAPAPAAAAPAASAAAVPPATAAPASAKAPAPAPVEAEPEKSPDDAYIETPRCSTCNECTQLNDKMFAYNENKQAYIANVEAGTYAQLVEAAESCQVSIIHPGKPRNPKEPGLEALLKRAELFQ